MSNEQKWERGNLVELNIKLRTEVKKELWKYKGRLCLAVIHVKKISVQLPKVFIASQWYEFVTKNARGILGYINKMKCLRQGRLWSHWVGYGSESTRELYVVF